MRACATSGGGVYKSFEVEGPGDYFFIVRKNNSFNTVMQGVFIDKRNGPPTDFEGHRDIWLGQVSYEAPPEEQKERIEKAALLALAQAPDLQYQVKTALDLWHAADESAGTFTGARDAETMRIFAYRAVAGAFAQTRKSPSRARLCCKIVAGNSRCGRSKIETNSMKR